jgi:hypothetical protein
VVRFAIEVQVSDPQVVAAFIGGLALIVAAVITARAQTRAARLQSPHRPSTRRRKRRRRSIEPPRPP